MLSAVVASGRYRNVVPINPFQAWYGKLANVQTQQERIYWIGDSISEGTGASLRTKRALDLMNARLAEKYPVAGQGQSLYLPAVFGCPTSGYPTNTAWGGLWATSTSGTVSPQLGGIYGAGSKATTYGLGLRSVNLTSTNATATYTVNGTVADLWFAAGGSFTYAVDGGAYSAAVNTSAWNAQAQLYPITLGASGPHTVSIRRSAGTVKFLGFTVFDGARDKGIAMFDASHWSAQVIDFWDYTNASAPQNLCLTRNLQLVSPGLVVINVGVNDVGNIGQQGIAEVIARLTGMLGGIRAAVPTASIAYCLVYDQVPDSQLMSDGNTAGYLKTKLYEWVAANNLGLIDLSTLMPDVFTDTGGNYYPDEEHLTDAGELLMANVTGPLLAPLYDVYPLSLSGTLPAAVAGEAYHGELTLGGTYVTPVTIDASVGTLPEWLTVAVVGTTVTFDGTAPDEAGTFAFTVRATAGDAVTATSVQSIGVTLPGALTRPIVGVSVSKGGTGASAAVTTTDGATFVIIIGECTADYPTMPPVDSYGNTYTLVDSKGTTDYKSTTWICIGGRGGSGHTFTNPNVDSYGSMSMVEFKYVAAVGAYAGNAYAAGASYLAGTVTPAALTDVVVSLAFTDWSGSTAAPSVTSGFTIATTSYPVDVATSIAVQDAATTSATSATWAQTNGVAGNAFIMTLTAGTPPALPLSLAGTLPNGKVGVAYTGTLSLAGTFTGPIVFDASTGTLPAWMTFTVSGTTVNVTGTPTDAGTSLSFTVRATDSSDPAQVATAAQVITITPASTGSTPAKFDTSTTIYGQTVSADGYTASFPDSNGGIPLVPAAAVEASTANQVIVFTINALTVDSGTFAVGLGLPSVFQSPGREYSSEPASIGVRPNGNLAFNQSVIGTGPSYAVGDKVIMCLKNGSLYFGTVAGGWYGGSNPDTNTGALASGITGPVVPVVGGKGANVTVNTGLTAWPFTPPVGSSGWSVPT